MTAYEWTILAAASLAAGAQNSLAGGGTLLTFPALLMVLPPGDASKVIANATSTVALLPGSAAGAWGFRHELRDVRHWVRLLVLPSLIGGLIGSFLVAWLPERLFAALVPWLILTATLLFLLQPAIAKLTGIGQPHSEPSSATKVGVVAFQFGVAIYGGYFGAGIGILMLSSLALMGLGDIHRMNAAKTFLAACINVTSVVVFAWQDVVNWRLAPPMAIASIFGGYLGAHYGRRLPKALVRWGVILLGFGLAAKYFAER